MLVDWLKHAYITKFNNTKPAVYGRFLDVLAKDYYSNAFFDQNLTKRLGLPVLPLACLFIRATIQTYHMFLATHMPLPIPSSATSLSVESSQATSSSPATTAALAHIDHIFRRALGRSSFGAGGNNPSTVWHLWSLDDAIAFTTMIVVFLVAYFVLLAFKLVLGMCLLGFARSRYKGMKEREKMVTTTDGKRVGGWGVVEVEDDKKRWIYADDADGLRALRDREAKTREREEKGGGAGRLEGTSRYSMVAKRIW
ncbi:Membrane proteinTapt1/CMV receptor [Neofusicoccum parvum]|nr:Membrane proteinTapt1/CMV receptor [Neofusicoccum parvum]GME56338.1 Membrane proteinTapt1/CMV receptor [Neofusicoccum parvum]